MPLKRTELAYAAGIIDGEGCIRFNRQKSQCSVLRVHVTNTDPRLTQWLKDKFGGYVWSESKAYIPNAKPRYVWEISAKQAEIALRQIEPYLMLKRDRALIALAHRATIKHGTNKLKPGTAEKRSALVIQLNALNRRGTDAS